MQAYVIDMKFNLNDFVGGRWGKGVEFFLSYGVSRWFALKISVSWNSNTYWNCHNFVGGEQAYLRREWVSEFQEWDLCSVWYNLSFKPCGVDSSTKNYFFLVPNPRLLFLSWNKLTLDSLLELKIFREYSLLEVTSLETGASECRNWFRE